MAMQTTENGHQLSGDWTIAGVVNQVDLLSHALGEIASTQKEHIHIDCGGIDAIDMSGLQLLHVWLQCAKIRGIRTKLINLPESMQQTIQCLGLQHAFTDNYPDAA